MTEPLSDAECDALWRPIFDARNRSHTETCRALIRAGYAARPPVAQDADDTARLDWILPLLCGADNPEADARTIAIGKALMAGLDGRAAIDAGRQGEDAR